MRRLAALAAFLLLGLPALAAPSQGVPLAAHRALYAMTLDRARGDVISAHGTMGYEVIDACDGWAVRQRLDMLVTNNEGQTVEMISDYATWEDKGGRRLRFHMKQTTDEAVSSQTDGDATMEPNGGPGVARYTKPRHVSIKLPPGTLFPMAHTAAIIAAARAGKRLLNLPLFDGTSETGAEDSNIVISGWDKPRPTRWPLLSKLPSTVVHIAFYDWNATTMLPDYQAGMRYWENGVADDMTMDFGDFVMDAKMTQFAPQPRHC
jgi:hypothetical protein